MMIMIMVAMSQLGVMMMIMLQFCEDGDMMEVAQVLIFNRSPECQALLITNHQQYVVSVGMVMTMTMMMMTTMMMIMMMIYNHSLLSRFLLTLSMGSSSRWPAGKTTQENYHNHDDNHNDDQDDNHNDDQDDVHIRHNYL